MQGMNMNFSYLKINISWALIAFTAITVAWHQSTTVQVELRTVKVIETIYDESSKCIEHDPCLLLAEAIYHESRGEPIEGQVAVGHVILNRVNSKYHPNTVEKVIKQGCQFTYRCDNSIHRGIRDLSAFQKSLLVAEGLINGIFDDPTDGADHYLNTKKVKKIPKWAKKYENVATIGNHQFHKRI
jgi:spore germination cell wall hydrolase CwlJ-like protein